MTSPSSFIHPSDFHIRFSENIHTHHVIVGYITLTNHIEWILLKRRKEREKKTRQNLHLKSRPNSILIGRSGSFSLSDSKQKHFVWLRPPPRQFITQSAEYSHHFPIFPSCCWWRQGPGTSRGRHLTAAWSQQQQVVASKENEPRNRCLIIIKDQRVCLSWGPVEWCLPLLVLKSSQIEMRWETPVWCCRKCLILCAFFHSSWYGGPTLFLKRCDSCRFTLQPCSWRDTLL